MLDEIEFVIRTYDGFDHWQPGGVGVPMVSTEDSTTPGASGTPLPWAGYNGDVSSVSGREGHAISIDDPFGFIFVNLEYRYGWIVGVASYQARLYDGWASAAIRLRDSVSATDTACVAIDSLGRVAIYSGDMERLVARSRFPVVSASSWYYLEFGMYRDSTPDSNGNLIPSGAAYLEARIDGSMVASATIDFDLPNDGGRADQVMLCTDGSRIFDDFYAMTAGDQGGPVVSGFIGPIEVELWLPATDSETGAFRWKAGSPPHTGAYPPSGFGLGASPLSLVTTPGDAFAAMVGTRLPAGDSGFIESDYPIGSPLMLGISPPVDNASRIYAYSIFAVARSSATSAMSLGTEKPSSLPPYFLTGGMVSGTVDAAEAWAIAYGGMVSEDEDGEGITQAHLAATRLCLRYYADTDPISKTPHFPTEIYLEADSGVAIRPFAHRAAAVPGIASSTVLVTPHIKTDRNDLPVFATSEIKLTPGRAIRFTRLLDIDVPLEWFTNSLGESLAAVYAPATTIGGILGLFSDLSATYVGPPGQSIPPMSAGYLEFDGLVMTFNTIAYLSGD